MIEVARELRQVPGCMKEFTCNTEHLLHATDHLRHCACPAAENILKIDYCVTVHLQTAEHSAISM